MKMSIKKRLEQLEQSLAVDDASGFGSLSLETRRAVVDFVRRDDSYGDAARRAAVLDNNGDTETAATIKAEAWEKLRVRVTNEFGQAITDRIFAADKK